MKKKESTFCFLFSYGWAILSFILYLLFYILYQNMSWHTPRFPIPAHIQPMKNASRTMISTFDPLYIRQETWANCVRSCHMLFLLSVHIKDLSSKNTLRMLIFHSLTIPVMALVQEERRGDLGLVIYSGRSLALIHIHSSSVPHVCPALKKTNNGYPSLSSRSPLSTHYPSSIGLIPSLSSSLPYTHLAVHFHVKQRDPSIIKKKK